MHVLFIHQNYPGQFVHLALSLSRMPGNTVVAIGENKPRPDFGYPVFGYDAPQVAAAQTHHYIRDYEVQIRRGQHVFRICRKLKARGFVPDVICAHPGWGESLFLKDIFPTAHVIVHCEFYYHGQGSDMNFDPEYPADIDGLLKVRIKNSTQLQAMVASDAGISPTQWQKSQYPSVFWPKIHVCHDGIDTDKVCPDRGAVLTLDDEHGVLTADDEVVTYVARNLEPYRGFHSFMRAVPHIQHMRPNAQIVVIGGDDVSYGRRLADGVTYRQALLKEVQGIDPDRVHFLGRVPYSVYLSALQISSVHVYLTYPFVLSWSCLEAMSAGCIVIASDTSPVREVVTNGKTGLLVDFFDSKKIADRVSDVLAAPQDFVTLGINAREQVRVDYDLRRVTLPTQMRLLTDHYKNQL
jgi:glycosyltransferase involved in cell wall biosynthesis